MPAIEKMTAPEIPQSVQDQIAQEPIPMETVNIEVTGKLKDGKEVSRVIEGQIPKGVSDVDKAAAAFGMIKQSGLIIRREDSGVFDFYPYEAFCQLSCEVKVVGITL